MIAVLEAAGLKLGWMKRWNAPPGLELATEVALEL
jgi:hypothetical protein